MLFGDCVSVHPACNRSHQQSAVSATGRWTHCTYICQSMNLMYIFTLQELLDGLTYIGSYTKNIETCMNTQIKALS